MDFSKLKPVSEADVAGKRVLVRADLNVPVNDAGVVTDTTRLDRLVPTLRGLQEQGARIIVLSHFGRPKGQHVPDMTLKPVAAKLAECLGAPVQFASDCIGEAAVEASTSLGNAEVCVFENLRFHKGEEANDASFAAELAKSGDIFVNDAFSAAHRAHASTAAIAGLLPSYVGPAMMAEISALLSALETPKLPTTAVVGGAKVSTKIPILTHLTEKVDKLIIGGGMANTFLQSMGVMVAQSLAEPEFHYNAREIMAIAKTNNCELILPIDAVVAREFRAGAETETVMIHKVPIDAMILDIGPSSVAKMTEALRTSGTVLWNGPMGAFELEPFGEGTFALAKEAARLTKEGSLVSIAGGGDTVAALNAAGVTDDFTYVSTAGGAFLEWLEGRELPGVAALARA